MSISHFPEQVEPESIVYIESAYGLTFLCRSRGIEHGFTKKSNSVSFCLSINIIVEKYLFSSNLPIFVDLTGMCQHNLIEPAMHAFDESKKINQIGMFPS